MCVYVLIPFLRGLMINKKNKSNKGAFIYYVINLGGRGVSQMLMFVDKGEGCVHEKITDYVDMRRGLQKFNLFYVKSAI